MTKIERTAQQLALQSGSTSLTLDSNTGKTTLQRKLLFWARKPMEQDQSSSSSSPTPETLRYIDDVPNNRVNERSAQKHRAVAKVVREICVNLSCIVVLSSAVLATGASLTY